MNYPRKSEFYSIANTINESQKNTIKKMETSERILGIVTDQQEVVIYDSDFPDIKEHIELASIGVSAIYNQQFDILNLPTEPSYWLTLLDEDNIYIFIIHKISKKQYYCLCQRCDEICEKHKSSNFEMRFFFDDNGLLYTQNSIEAKETLEKYIGKYKKIRLEYNIGTPIIGIKKWDNTSPKKVLIRGKYE